VHHPHRSLEFIVRLHHVCRALTGRTRFALVGLAVCLTVVGAQSLAATSPSVWSVPDTGSYAGKQFATTALIAKGVSCNLVGSALSCFDTEAGARAALGEVALACAPLVVYDTSGYGGASLSVANSGTTNLGAFANRTSSWKSGCKQGRLTDVATGTVRNLAANSQENVPAAFDNRADTAWRP
jgi:hypothetical protein